MTPTHTLRRFASCLAAVGLVVSTNATLYAQEDEPDAAPVIRWQAKDNTGEPVTVPAAGKTSLVLFVMPDQPRSDEALKQLTAILNEDGRLASLQPVAVVSGQNAGAGAATLSQSGDWTYPVVVDTDYQASGTMTVRVWPTTVIIDQAGTQLAHLPGLRGSYTKDVRAYLDFAAGTIDEAELTQRLETNGTVASTADNVASRHLHLAEKLLEKGQAALARDELQRGLASDPDDVDLKLTLAHVRLMLDEPTEALAVLDTVGPDDAPLWRTGTLRGRALVALERYDEARTVLTEALRIDPDPSQALYYLGRVHEHAGEWEQAAQAYRQAYEKSPAGDSVSTP